MLQRFLLLWLTLLSLLAYFWPLVWTGFDPFVESKPHLRLLIQITMFSIGCLLPRDEIRQVIARWPTVLGGTAIQYACMPLLAFLVGHAFQLPADEMTGLIMVGCVPGAMASNVLTLAARGNVSYSISLTTSATLLSPLIVPFALNLLLGASRSLNVNQVFLDLLLMVVGPVLVGHLLCRTIPPVEKLMRICAPISANATILWIIAVVVGINRERLGSITLTVLAALITVNLLGYAAGFVGGNALRLTTPMKRALTLEVGMQNAGLGTVLTLQLFPESPAAAIPTAAYTFGCMLTGTLLAQIWARQHSKEEEGRRDVEAVAVSTSE